MPPSRPRFPLLWFALTIAAHPAFAAPPPEPPHEFRLGFSYSMLSDVNQSDAKASIRALSETFSRERGITANPEPLLFSGTDNIAAAIDAGQVDALALATDEYWLLADTHRVKRFLVATQQGEPTEQYVLLVRRDAAFSALADLAGRSLLVCPNSRTRLGYIWCHVLLAREGLPGPVDHFGRVTLVPKLSRAVLDVFFHKADACLVTRRVFAAMTELNPQIGAQLIPLATSPPYVPALFVIRYGMPPDFEAEMAHEFTTVQDSPAGRQGLMIFQVDRVREYPPSILDGALALLTEFTQLCPATSAALALSLRHDHVGLIAEVQP